MWLDITCITECLNTLMVTWMIFGHWREISLKMAVARKLLRHPLAPEVLICWSSTFYMLDWLLEQHKRFILCWQVQSYRSQCYPHFTQWILIPSFMNTNLRSFFPSHCYPLISCSPHVSRVFLPMPLKSGSATTVFPNPRSYFRKFT